MIRAELRIVTSIFFNVIKLEINVIASAWRVDVTRHSEVARKYILERFLIQFHISKLH